MPRPPEHRPGLRRENNPRQKIDARQDVSDPSQQQQRVSRTQQSIHCNALSLTGNRARDTAGVSGNYRLDRRWRDHGCAPQNAGRGRCTVSPGVYPDRAWA